MIYLAVAELLVVAERATGQQVVVRDHGLLAAAAVRPMSSVFGADDHPSLETKAAALTQSLARNHALVDGNERLALAGLIAFLGLNGRSLTLSDDEAYDLVTAMATGELGDVDAIADVVGRGTAGR